MAADGNEVKRVNFWLTEGLAWNGCNQTAACAVRWSRWPGATKGQSQPHLHFFLNPSVTKKRTRTKKLNKLYLEQCVHKSGFGNKNLQGKSSSSMSDCYVTVWPLSLHALSDFLCCPRTTSCIPTDAISHPFPFYYIENFWKFIKSLQSRNMTWWLVFDWDVDEALFWQFSFFLRLSPVNSVHQTRMTVWLQASCLYIDWLAFYCVAHWNCSSVAETAEGHFFFFGVQIGQKWRTSR